MQLIAGRAPSHTAHGPQGTGITVLSCLASAAEGLCRCMHADDCLAWHVHLCRGVRGVLRREVRHLQVREGRLWPELPEAVPRALHQRGNASPTAPCRLVAAHVMNALACAAGILSALPNTHHSCLMCPSALQLWHVRAGAGHVGVPLRGVPQRAADLQEGHNGTCWLCCL